MTMKTYSLKEASKVLGVTYRTIDYYKGVYESEVIKDGRIYFVTEAFLDKVRSNKKYLESRESSDPRTKTQLVTELDEAFKKIEALESRTDNVDDSIKKLEKKYKSKFDELNKALKEKNDKLRKAEKRIKELESENPFEIEEGKRVEVFTDEEYSVFEQRLREWFSLQREIQLKDESFKAQLNSKDEVIDHYKNQFEYQRQLAERQLDQMDKLLGYLKDRNTREAERARIEAVEKNVIPRADGYDPYGSAQR